MGCVSERALRATAADSHRDGRHIEMNSFYDWINASAAAFVLRAILFSLAGILTLIGSIVARRKIRRRYFDRLADAEFHVRQHWDEIVAGEIPREEWSGVHRDTEAIITVSLDRMEGANAVATSQLAGRGLGTG